MSAAPVMRTAGSGVRAVGPGAQVRALLALRWQMVRSSGLRASACLGVAAVLWLLVLCLTSTGALEPAALETAVALAPQAYLGFGVLALVAPLTAGGGNEVVPPDQLVAYPVRPSTQFAGGLLLAPVNLVWVVQLLVLAAETAFLTAGGRLLPGIVTTAAYVACLTVAGQALAWAVHGLRRTQAGRRAVGVAAAGLLVGAVLVVRSGAGPDLLAASPTRTVVRAVVAGGTGDLVTWAATTLALLGATLVALAGGAAACAWALRRAGDAGAQRDARSVRRRRPQPSALRQLVAVDRASVWRAPALRRGGLVLAVLPGLAAAGAEVPWASLVVLPGLVAAGAGLLFGINAFCLDGPGAVWLASLPADPAVRARAKLLVLGETVLAAVVLAAVTGSLRSPGSPTPTELVAIVTAALTCTAVVTATCFSLSVRRPHRAELAGPRDAVAPPGALAAASVRLALPTALTGLLLGAAAGTGTWWMPLLLAVPPVLLSGLSLRRSLARWADPAARARVVQVVSAG